MFRARRTYSLLTLPLIVALAVVALCPSLACAAPRPVQAPAPASVCGDAASKPMPLHHNSDTPTRDGKTCQHELPAVKAATPEQHLTIDYALASTSAVTAAPLVRVAFVDTVHPTSPPSLVLTASHLRI